MGEPPIFLFAFYKSKIMIQDLVTFSISISLHSNHSIQQHTMDSPVKICQKNKSNCKIHLKFHINASIIMLKTIRVLKLSMILIFLL